jgi:uncharacterized membrane protein YdfJ with MMPL/SSD domain
VGLVEERDAVAVFVLDTILGFKAIRVPLLAFLFLVALGVDDNIFLISRAREETMRLGTRKAMPKPSPPPVASSPRQAWS